MSLHNSWTSNGINPVQPNPISEHSLNHNVSLIKPHNTILLQHPTNIQSLTHDVPNQSVTSTSNSKNSCALRDDAQLPHNTNSHALKDKVDLSTCSLSVFPGQSFLFVSTFSTYYKEPPCHSKATLVAECWDHPSWAQPPHQPLKCNSKSTSIPQVLAMPLFDVLPSFAFPYQDPVEKMESVDVLVPNSYPVPPPPPYKESAAPLSDLASEMVWERCYTPGPYQSHCTSPLNKLFSNPVNDSTFLGGLPSDHHVQGYKNYYSSVNSTSPWAAIHGHHQVSPVNMMGVNKDAMKANHFQPNSQQDIKPLRTEVKPAFRRWTQQVLEQTLLSPQVLVLALYYVDVLSGQDVFGDSNQGKSSLMPYKTLLAALVLANKTLDDHSYKNSTFATISSMTNAEVNTIEAAMLKALKFDTLPGAKEWRNWLGVVVMTGKRARMNSGMIRKKEEEVLIEKLKLQHDMLMYESIFG
ncbi:uncharacterized protein MELLADRAFT_93011 [Melampsora larici-populina 98AG31]|uniref:Cyclin N-terminal domain-containing protein n=1 Tax=Melampsora larici-populina (strain 98AG31 / pathotype 3-4-7) TaxID=747676 RepID=F4S3L1_MELLP|nr:uncharacterized protein MELLADRAFT_93011 [Melampsora larici-populina 98AG31]EGG00687.1 hypothetical protein MELLADRAFT_93011 [Melampsora larici-populina 98AG31]